MRFLEINYKSLGWARTEKMRTPYLENFVNELKLLPLRGGDSEVSIKLVLEVWNLA